MSKWKVEDGLMRYEGRGYTIEDTKIKEIFFALQEPDCTRKSVCRQHDIPRSVLVDFERKFKKLMKGV